MNRILEKTIRIVDIILSFVLAGTVVVLGFSRFWQDYNAVVLVFLLLAGGICSGIFCHFFHELGHLLFGLFCGFRFNAMQIGLISIYRQDGKIRVAIQRLPESLAGSTQMLPKNAVNLYSKFLITISGGLIFSFICLVASAVTLCLYEIVPFFAYIFVCTAIPFAFHIFFYNILPFNDDNLDTDGGMLRGLIKKEPSYLTAVNILTIEGYLYQGKTPAEMDSSLYFGLPQLPEDDINFILLTSYRLSYYIDLGDMAAAAKTADRLCELLPYVPKIYYNEIASEILFCDCFIKGDFSAAQEKYTALRPYLIGEKSLQTFRICAAYELYVNDDKVSALRALSAAQERADSCHIEGVQRYERKLISYIRRDLDAHK